MSIIQDALKKSEETYFKKTLQDEAAGNSEETTAAIVDAAEDIPALRSGRNLSSPSVLIPVFIVLTITVSLGLKVFVLDKSMAAAKYTAKDEVKHNAALKPAEPAVLAPKRTVDALHENISVETKNTPPGRLETPAQPPDLALNGIMYIKGKPRAIINGNVVEVGESVGGAMVSAIDENKAFLNYNGAEIILKLKK